MELNIRQYHTSDLVVLYRICLLTGDNGNDASSLYQDPDLLGQYYVGPYVYLEPELCFVLLHYGMPCGYILGTRDSAAFSIKCEREWFPLLRQRYTLLNEDDSSLDGRVIRSIREGRPVDDRLIPDYPAHLHIWRDSLNACASQRYPVYISASGSRIIVQLDFMNIWDFIKSIKQIMH